MSVVCESQFSFPILLYYSPQTTIYQSNTLIGLITHCLVPNFEVPTRLVRQGLVDSVNRPSQQPQLSMPSLVHSVRLYHQSRSSKYYSIFE